MVPILLAVCLFIGALAGDASATALDAAPVLGRRQDQDKTTKDVLQKYKGQVTELVSAISNAILCYQDYEKKIEQQGDTDGIDACDKQYENVIYVLLPDAQITASDPHFPNKELLTEAELPDIRTGESRHENSFTWDYLLNLELLERYATHGSERKTQETQDVKELKAIISEEIPAAVNKTIVDTAYALVQYVGLRHILKEKGTAESAAEIANATLEKFFAELGPIDKIVDEAFETILSQAEGENSVHSEGT